MKKFIASILLVFMLVPFAFVATACNFGKDDEYDKEANVKAFHTAMESLENVGDNYTLITEVKASDDLATLTGVDIAGLTNVQIKKDGDNSHILTNSLEVYDVNGITYHRQENEQTEQWGKFQISNMSTITAGDYIDLELLKDVDLEILLNLAYKTNPEAITTSVTDYGTVVTISVDLDAVLNKIIKIVTDNKDNSIETLINALLVDLGVENTTLQSLFAEVKEFVTPNTTVEQVFDYVEQRTGIDLTKLMEFEYSINSYLNVVTSMDLSANLPSSIGAGWFNDAKSTNLANADYDLIKNEKILKFLGDGVTEEIMDETLDSVYSQLSNPANTLITMLDTALANSGLGYTAQEIVDYLEMITVDKLHLEIDLTTNNNNQFVQLTAGVDFGVTLKTGGISTSVAFSVEGSVYVTDIGTTVIALPSNMPTDEVTAVINVASLNSDNGLTLTNVTFPCAVDFAIEEFVTYNATSKTMAISAEVVTALKDMNEYVATDEWWLANYGTFNFNAIVLDFAQNGIEYRLIIAE